MSYIDNIFFYLGKMATAMIFDNCFFILIDKTTDPHRYVGTGTIVLPAYLQRVSFGDRTRTLFCEPFEWIFS
jgi:hypothetical protein